jgi:hypothetical protein
MTETYEVSIDPISGSPGVIRRVSDNVFIPLDANNTDFGAIKDVFESQLIQDQIASGNLTFTVESPNP